MEWCGDTFLSVSYPSDCVRGESGAEFKCPDVMVSVSSLISLRLGNAC